VSELVGVEGNIPVRSYNIYLKNQRVAEEKHIEMPQKRAKINEAPATDKEFWVDLSSETPIAIKLLRERINFEKTFEKTQLFANRGINWEILCGNNSQGAIELVKERIKIEKTMPYFQVLFYNKKYKYGVSWAFLCSNTNPEAFKLLREKIVRLENLLLAYFK
jgi:hypothetical protein